MTAKDKAKELYDRYCQINNIDEADHIRKACARLSAGVAVDEIVKALEEYGQTTFELQNMDREFAYWDMVKFNINLL